jgi:ribosomal protein S18 acetylase RimI-like enzyme
MSLSLDTAVAGDAADIGEISVLAWQASYRGTMPDRYLDSLDGDERAGRWVETLRAPPPRTRVILARQQRRSVGFVASGPCWTDTDLGEVYALNVRPDTWGQGIGASLLSAATSDLRDAGFTEAILWVLPGNTRARRFYEAHGWHDEGLERDEQVHDIVVAEVRYRLLL